MDKVVKLFKKEPYVAPDIEVLQIELEQTLLSGSGNLPGMGGEDW